jgi:hypothetical protein
MPVHLKPFKRAQRVLSPFKRPRKPALEQILVELNAAWSAMVKHLRRSKSSIGNNPFADSFAP